MGGNGENTGLPIWSTRGSTRGTGHVRRDGTWWTERAPGLDPNGPACWWHELPTAAYSRSRRGKHEGSDASGGNSQK